MYNAFIEFVKSLYPNQGFIPLHEPRFIGNEKNYLNDCIDSTFVSSVGKYVDQFEDALADKLGADYAVATVNGTAALHMCLLLVGVEQNDEVITQPLTFIATCNAIAYCSAHPVFVDVDLDTMGMSPESLRKFLECNAKLDKGVCYNKTTGRRITACIPMHTFGHPCRIDEIRAICDKYGIKVIEDAAESLGSTYKGKHLGNFGHIAAMSFNGNKIVTSGGGGAIITNDERLARKAKHLTTTAKLKHPWKFEHDCIGYNYRMPNLNAALLCAQLENLDMFLSSKRQVAESYQSFFKDCQWARFIPELEDARSNYWLNAILLSNPNERDSFLKMTNDAGVMTRPVWKLMNDLPMFNHALGAEIPNALKLEKSIVNIPSSVRL
ncbi:MULTISPECIES: LegC family aminotransferase [Cysteiniphilum]|uniref:GDP-perosamine synthase n=1 Tax=Cysteiniphilum litorale TaxID=2056700 RepID=A0A8J2Z3Y8_9GAMM|nr:MULTISPECIES: LegC family aminotransferase [Cysteiniphilum]GGF94446.1 aminotransferase DegT [Cysteiniphilum litorale]